MRTSKALRIALNTIQASGVDARTLSDRTGMCYMTCRKILRDTKGQLGYHWSTVEFALKHVGCELVIVARPQKRVAVAEEGCSRRRLSG